MPDDCPYERPLKLDYDDVMISSSHSSYQIAIHVVDYYHQQAVLMTPDEQKQYVEMVHKSDYILSPTNRETPSNNKLWKYLMKPSNIYCRARFVMLAAIYGIGKLNGLRNVVEQGDNMFDIRDFSQFYNHYYYPSPSPTIQEAVPAANVSINEPTTTHDMPGDNASLLSPISVYLSGAPAIDGNATSQPAPPSHPPCVGQPRDPFLPQPLSPITIASDSDEGQNKSPPYSPVAEPVDPNSALNESTAVLEAPSLDPQAKSPVYSPRLEPTPTTNVDEVSLLAKIAELEKKAQSHEEEKSFHLQVIRDQAVAYNQLQRQFEEHMAGCNHH
ncbi:hypothetical protein V8C43DRAFT_57194 [Trichoderma afarasin]